MKFEVDAQPVSDVRFIPLGTPYLYKREPHVNIGGNFPGSIRWEDVNKAHPELDNDSRFALNLVSWQPAFVPQSAQVQLVRLRVADE